jgi:hypothetical protein
MGFGSSRHTFSYADSDGDGNQYANSNINTYGYGYRNGYFYYHCHRHCYCNRNSYCYRHGNSNSYSDSHSHPYTNAQSDSETDASAKNYACTKTTGDSRAPALAGGDRWWNALSPWPAVASAKATQRVGKRYCGFAARYLRLRRLFVIGFSRLRRGYGGPSEKTIHLLLVGRRRIFHNLLYFFREAMRKDDFFKP